MDPVDRVNEIEDDIADLGAFEQIPGEAKFYRTSTEAYDDFAPPQGDVSDGDTKDSKPNAMNDTVEPQELEPKIEPVQPEVLPETASTEPPMIDGLLFLDLVKIFAEAGAHFLPKASEELGPESVGNGPTNREDTDKDVEVKTESPDSDETTTSGTIQDVTTEMYKRRTLKRPTIISQTVKDVLQAFKLLHNWRFTK